MQRATVECFNEIYDATYKSVMAVLASKCGNVSDIADLAQETYMELYQTLCRHGTGHVRNAKGLTLKIARRKLAKHYAKAERQPVTLLENDYADSYADDCLDLTISAVMAEQARAVLRSKPDEVQKIFTLFYDVELTIPQIAKSLGISQSSVKNKLYRTLHELRRAIA